MTVPPARSGWRRLPLRMMLAAAVTLFLAFSFAGAPWDEVGRAVMSASPLWLGLAILSNLMIYPPWVLQWQLLARPSVRLSAGSMFNVVALSAMGTAAMSSLVGAASAVVLLVARGGMTTLSAAMLMLMDQILVGLAKLTVLVLALMVAPIPTLAAQGGIVLGVLTLSGLVLLLLLAHFGPRTQQATGHEGVKAWLWVNLTRLTQSLEVLRRPPLAFATLILALAKKATEIGAAYAIAMACGVEASPTLAILVVAAVSLTTAVPLVPGSLGVYSATVFAIYQFLGYPVPIALAAGILQHLVELAPPVFVGYGTIIMTRLSAKRRQS